MRWNKNTLESLMLRIEKTGGHWLWTGAVDGDGYGSVAWQGKRVGTHRVFYEEFVGPVPDGFDVDHIQDDSLCGIPRCCNPDHLRAVTHRENMIRSSSFVALKARQTHCIHGHEFTEANTHWRTNGTRACRACEVIRHRRAYLRLTSATPEAPGGTTNG